MNFSKRMNHFDTGIFSLLLDQKQRRLAQGQKVVDLSVGTPNIPPAPHIIKALTEAAADPQNYIYAISDTAELQNAVAQWYKRRYNVAIDPAKEMVSLLGSQDGLAHISLSIVDEDDVVLVPDPGYPIFSGGPLLAGAKLYPMPQRRENGYIIDLKEIPEEVARAAKFMVVSYPNNPVTAIAPSLFYQDLVEFALKNDIIVLHDNAYSELVFDGYRCGSFLAYDGAKEVGVEFNSLSKTYGLAGARIGFAIGNSQVISKLCALKSNIDYGMFVPIQKAAIAAITGPQDCVETTRAVYQKRRDVLVDGLSGIGWHMDKPPATMFVWARIPQKFTSSNEFAMSLMEKTGMMVVPGSAFGPAGEGHVRMALVQNENEILYCIEQIKKSKLLQ